MTSSTTRYANNRLQPAHPSPLATLGVVKLPPNSNLSAGTVLGALTEGTPAAAVHTLTFTGTVTGGTFRLQYGSDITGPIAYSGTAATQVANIQAATDALFGAGNTVVAGTGPYTVTFQNGLTNLAIPIPTVLSNLTGTSPVLTPTLTTPGVSGGTVFAAYNDALSDGTQVARCLLAEDTVTDFRGRRVTDRPSGKEAQDSAPVYTAGPFYCSDLIGLDANGVTDIGRIINATAYTQPHAVLVIK